MSLILDIEYSLKKLEEVSSLFKSQGGLGALYGV
jgi:hypothetical protein